MELFTYSREETSAKAIEAGKGKDARFIAGGTTLFDLMKLDVEKPKKLVDVNHLPLDKIERSPDGGLKIGALARNSEVAHHPEVFKNYPVLSQAILAGASAQIRNRATTAGNLLQRTRCVYFRDPAMPCNKREPGSGCSAIEGFHRNLAILGTSDHCIASNPSDQNVALMALNATVHVQSSKGTRTVPIASFYLLPGETPHKETVLEAGELITHVSLPPLSAGSKSHYLKLRDRASYEFALASTAIVVRLEGERFADIALAMGGVGTIPWWAKEAEGLLKAHPASPELFARAADAVFKDAKPHVEHGFKVELGRRCLIQALTLATRNS